MRLRYRFSPSYPVGVLLEVGCKQKVLPPGEEENLAEQEEDVGEGGGSGIISIPL